MLSEKELPFDLDEDLSPTDSFNPGFYDQILTKDHMYKDVSPFLIKTSIHQCFACDMKKYQKPLELSNFNASIMIIGETSSDIDFQTKEGKLLADSLKWAGYDLDDIYFTALAKCTDTPTPHMCFHHLLSEIMCVKPSLIFALGYDVGKYFDPSINQAGYKSNFMDQYPIFTTYRLLYTMKDQQLFQDFCNHLLQAKHDNRLQKELNYEQSTV